MEEAMVCSPLPDLKQLNSQTCTSLELLPPSRPLEEAIRWGEMEKQVSEADREKEDNSPQTGRISEEPEEHWDSMTLPVYPMTCPSVLLSFATVQWDMPDLSPDTPFPMTDNSLADELDSSGAASLDWTLNPLSLHHHHQQQQHQSCVTMINIELSVQEKTEKHNRPEQQLPLDSENSHPLLLQFQACDTPSPDVEASAQQLFEEHDSLSESSPRQETEKEMGQPVTEDTIPPSDRAPSPVQTGESETGQDSESLDSVLGEEQEQTSRVLTIPINSEQGSSSANYEEKEQDVTNLVYNGDCDEQTEQTEQSEGREQSDREGESETIELLEHLFEPAELKEQSELTEKSEHSWQSEPNHTKQSEYKDNTETTEQPEESEQLVESDQVEHSNQLGEEEQQTEETRLQQAEQSDKIDQSESEQTECLESKQLQQTQHSQQTVHSEQTEFSVQTEPQTETSQEMEHSEDSEQSKQSGETEQTEQSTDSDQSKQSGETEQSEQTEQLDQTDNKPVHSKQLDLYFHCTEELEQSDHTEEQKQSEIEQPAQTELTELTEEGAQTEHSKQVEELEPKEYKEDSCLPPREGSLEQLESQVQQTEASEPVVVHMNGGVLDREKACRLAERLYRLDGIHKTDVVKHLDKDNGFSQAVGQEYLKFFDFTGQSLDQGLRSFLRVVVLIGETQERERVLQHFSCRFQQCNPHTFSSSGEVLTLTCAVMLLNSDLHGQNVGKAMSVSSFVSNLDGMNEGENFSKELLKALYNTIKNEPLEWAVDEKELKSSMLLVEDAKEDAPLRSKSNPFQDVPHDKKATVFKQGFLKRKAHADIDGKRTPWGKRSWKTFFGVLKGMVLYLQKDEYKMEWLSTEEVVSVHHALAEQAADYTKRPHVFRLQTADWRVFLFQASSTAEMSSWISRINLVSALHSSPPFPAAVGSQRRFCRPILPASQSAHTLERQLQSHARMLLSFQEDLAYLQQSLPESRRAKAKELEEHRVREEYLQHEKCRYKAYIQMLEVWKGLNQSVDTEVGTSELSLFDRAVCKDTVDEEGEEGTLKKSHSSPSLDVEMALPHVVKVKRNISERRTYRKIVIPRRNRDI
ncbi:PH and SEC7 domain-containing protein 4 isoform X1 [Oncorhynchus tshawytscha]|uniref:PH and SEC7 domain-containing protein 4-like n=2 Tax=Oncorhynchus tshawytscha TaxID=74940 RepID=A0AAZ3PVE4_ONCTS|nr:PH and SEC7 domain-containing protein 4 isoform X1 [Oncorhynchus tshawytscha]XP_042158286.1 PH and SEC7 domain-containing protein 4 isoform X1 [Oncorhynchus tshawytscha]XP_042158287.1 PH and SEC7 domain-containing protein 4 isoform X1 [Oncorhynchus tshawytscha]XP_042158288.1 PH and SEC7 domain-containing protein 4 isoform X1 [Oncorhynchus tshawytscha]XP_042158289.1 PH and SEC7 domain-containing protein 4 isoform X1 [Oncorhynchus tshawytscha]